MSAPVRVHPFTGLVVDVDTWATAHDYHRRHQQLHLLTLHGSGVAHGLEVLPTDPPSDTIVIEPGMAIDDFGNVIIVPERQRLGLGGESDLIYVVLDYVESLLPTAHANQHEERGRIVEDFRLRALPSLPESPALELARVPLQAGNATPILNPANPWSPGANEIDCRFRHRAYPRATQDVSVGLMVCGGEENLDAHHLLGFNYFLRELDNAGLRPQLVTVDERKVPATDVLYITGHGEKAVPPASVKLISERLGQGGWLFADACGQGVDLVQSLVPAVKGEKNAAALSEAAVLGSHFVFGAAPPGALATREIIWGHNAVLSPRDYGCAWAGHHGDQALQREQIRSALEFAVNVAFCASRVASPL
jgi:hypothetical protein